MLLGMKQKAAITKVEGVDEANPKTTFTAVADTPMMNPMRRKRRLLLLQIKKEAVRAPPIMAAMGITVKNNATLDCWRLLATKVSRRI